MATVTKKHRNWGGARPGAGRPPKGETAGVSHLRRPALASRQALGVILRVKPGLPSLRTPALRASLRDAVAEGRSRFGFTLLTYSVRHDALRLSVQAIDRRALSRGIQGLSIRIARAINRSLERQGRVFADRYEIGD